VSGVNVAAWQCRDFVTLASEHAIGSARRDPFVQLAPGYIPQLRLTLGSPSLHSPCPHMSRRAPVAATEPPPGVLWPSSSPAPVCTNASCFFMRADVDQSECLDGAEIFTLIDRVGHAVTWAPKLRHVSCCTANTTACVDYYTACTLILQCVYGSAISFLYSM